MIILFPIELRYKAEVAAATKSGFKCLFYSHHVLTTAGLEAAFDQLPAQKNSRKAPALLRGYPLQPDTYQVVFEYLNQVKGIRLINAPHNYLETCSVVNHYAKIEAYCPKTVWTNDQWKAPEITQQTFGTGVRLMLKDYMRSEKYQRQKQYDIEDAANSKEVKNAVQQLITLKEGMVSGGFVFSEFLEFNRLEEFPLPGTNQPLYEEYRVWFFGGNLLLITGYFEELEPYHHLLEDNELTPFLEVAKNIDSQFFTLDIARKLDGSLAIIELNPGQVAGVNYYYHHQFYRNLAALT